MLDLSEITRRARETPRQTTDVEVVFDVGVTTELDRLRSEQADVEDQLEQVDLDLEAGLAAVEKDRRASDPRPAGLRKTAKTETTRLKALLDDVYARLTAVEEQAAEFLVTFRFTALRGFEWADLCARSQPRVGVDLDQERGYNIDEVAQIAASRCGVRLDDDGNPVDVSPDEWAAVWDTLPAVEMNRIRGQIFTLHEFSIGHARAEAVAAARKVSTARQAGTLDSRSTSGSTLDASTGGNPQKSPTTSTTTTAA